MDKEKDLSFKTKEASPDEEWCRIALSKNKSVKWGDAGFLPSFFFALAFVPHLLAFIGFIPPADGFMVILLNFQFLIFAFLMGIVFCVRKPSDLVARHAANVVSFVQLLAADFLLFIGSSSVIKREAGSWCYQLLFSVVLILFLSDAVRFWLRKPPLIRIPIWMSTALFVVSCLYFFLVVA